MRIDTIGIDGFGVWHDARLGLDRGLTVVCGDNEAGKTTLLAFIRSMLFGFEPNQYPAVAGGRRGGFLEITTEDGRHYRIERHGDRGGQGSLRVLDSHGIDRGAEHLARLLHGVEAAVYRNVFAFRHEELAELKGLTESGVVARIYGAGLGTGAASALAVETALRAELAARFKPGGQNPTINRLLREIEDVDRELARVDQPAAYAAAVAELRRHETDRDRLSAEIEARTSERRSLERIDAAWAPAQELKAAVEALEREGDVAAGVAVAPARHDLLAAELRAAAERVDDVQGRVDARRRRLAELRPDEGLLARSADIERVVVEWQARAAETAARRDAELRVAAAEREVAVALRQLGDGWTADRIEALDLSVAARSSLTGRFRELLDGAQRDVRLREAELAAATTLVAGAAGEVAELDARASGEPQRSTAAAAARVPAWLPLTTIPVGVAAVAAGIAGGPLVGVVVALLAAAAFAAVLAVTRGAPTSASNGAAPDDQWVAATRRHAQAEQRYAAAATALGDARAAQDAAVAEWGAWLTAHGYDPRVDRETAVAIFDAAVAARSALSRRDEAAHAGATLDARLAETVDAARQLLRELSRASLEASLDPAVGALGADLRASRAAAEERAVIERELHELGHELAVATERRDAARAAVERLLADCGASDEAELREMADRLARRRRHEEAASRARSALAILVGHGEPLERLLEAVDGVADIGAVRDRIASLRDELDRLANERDTVLRAIGALQGRISSLEASDELSALRQRRADLVSRLEADAEAWAMRRLALRLMEVTRQRYEREHRPRVLKAAEELLVDWTDGRWVGIVAPLGGGIEGLERADGRTVDIGGLSRGTQEQLYLALRFGLIEHFADEAEPLPIVMDETLVNFDGARCDRAARTIERMAQRHQILYFTCRQSPLRSSSVVRLERPALAGAVGADRPPALEPARA